ncbi:GNAT family N-acetyltransferase [Staphylococcus sp. ACRSN]|uniref:GNAT family N-acetyltransferase n=1 Tax=Staphylococcus sp. ACRSN TaxID=2918214 RepID=UPI001EF2EE53|nr:GNAT family N-acetyltransferase [Staphylococcus sp. ACRSN]MCG7338502.1 GNAT family N-acetyltransferase [Staphylococcus sp. ACRSN]
MIETERLKIIKPTLQYTKELFQIHAHISSTLYTPAGKHHTANDTALMIEYWLADWNNFGYGYFLFLDKYSHQLIGSGGIKNIYLDQFKVLNLYYRLHPDKTGQGYAYEAMQSIIQWIDTIVGKEIKMLIRTDRENQKSIKLANRLGFVNDDTYNDYIAKGDIFYFKNR